MVYGDGAPETPMGMAVIDPRSGMSTMTYRSVSPNAYRKMSIVPPADSAEAVTASRREVPPFLREVQDVGEGC